MGMSLHEHKQKFVAHMSEHNMFWSTNNTGHFQQKPFPYLEIFENKKNLSQQGLVGKSYCFGKCPLGKESMSIYLRIFDYIKYGSNETI